MSTTDSRTKFTRRRLLGGLGAATVALTSPIWRPATSFGAAPKPAKRFIGIFSANGTIPKEFWPAGTAADAPLVLDTAASPRILAPLASYASKMMLIKGADYLSTVPNKPGGPHMKGPGAMLTGGTLLPGPFTGSEGPAGYADRISLDQVIANRQAMAVDAPKFPSLEFGVRIDGQEPLRYISYRGASMPNTAVDDPWKIFSRIFSTTGMTDAQLLRTLADRKSVLDFLQDDIGRLSSRFTGADKARLDAHLTGIQRIEKQLTTGTQSCASPMLPAKIDPRAMANFPMIATIQMDLMTLALTCGLTNVATFMFANSDSWQYFPWIGVNEEHHTLSHGSDSDAANTEKLVKINIWHAEQVKYIADKLAAAPDADGTTVLDNSLIVWGNELGVGNTHSYKNIPWALIGGAGGSLKMGRYLQYAGQPHNNMLASIAQAFGLTDVTKFGDPAVATGMFTNMLA